MPFARCNNRAASRRAWCDQHYVLGYDASPEVCVDSNSLKGEMGAGLLSKIVALDCLQTLPECAERSSFQHVWRRAVISPAADQVAIRSVDWLSCDRLLACTGSSFSMLARSNTQCQCDACRHCRWTTRQPVARRQYAMPNAGIADLGWRLHNDTRLRTLKAVIRRLQKEPRAGKPRAGSPADGLFPHENRPPMPAAQSVAYRGPRFGSEC